MHNLSLSSFHCSDITETLLKSKSIHPSNTILRIYIILKMLVKYDTLSELRVLTGQCDIFYGPMMLN